MYNPLVPCPSCERHVMHQESHCPFCGELLDPAEAASRIAPDTNVRLGRAAAFVFGATVALAACSGDTEVGEDDGTSTMMTSSSSAGQGGFGAMYGGPTGGMGGEGGGSEMPLYGSPPGAGGAGGNGSGGDASGGAGGEGGGAAQPLYGSSPAPDDGAGF